MDNKNKVESLTKQKNKKRKWFIRILIIVILLLLLLFGLRQCGYIKFPWENGNKAIISADIFPDRSDAQDGHLPSMTKEEIMDQMQKIADSSRFAFKINSEPVFPNGNSPGNLLIENPSYNVYPMSVRIFLDGKEDSDHLLYDSGGLLPNQYIDSVKLQKVLKAGTYNATAYFYVYHPETKEFLGKQSANLKIMINQ